MSVSIDALAGIARNEALLEGNEVAGPVVNKFKSKPIGSDYTEEELNTPLKDYWDTIVVPLNPNPIDPTLSLVQSGGMVAPTGTTKTLVDVVTEETKSDELLKNLINFFQGQVKTDNITVNAPAKRVSVDLPLINKWGGLISGQGSYSPYGNNFLGFKYTRNW